MDYKVAVLIPCFNEEKTIGKVIEDFLSLDFIDKIYVCDNNSTDNSSKIIKSFNNNKIVYLFEQRQGKGYAVKKMFQEIEADCYILIDADDTYPIDSTSEMVDLIKNQNYDMVVGDRLSVNYHSQNKRMFHSFGNNLVKKLINILFKTNIKDTMSGFRAFNKKFVKATPLLSSGFEIETEMTILALDYNYKIKEIPIEYKNRMQGSISKLNTFSDGIKVLKTIFILFKDFKPFEFFSIIALLFLAISLMLFIPILFEFLETHLVLRFPTLIVSVCFAIFSLSTFNLGIILSVLIKIFKRNRELVLSNFKD
ncbi:MAG: glycosyltransferase [Candidatus Gastranaerophilales bacterium]|nr:glycosyltransferase [Candidatus Gastranaerophilales bacterium]